MPVHRIRLRGPWNYRWMESAESEAHEQTGTIQLPVSWREAFGRHRGVVRLARHFNRPTGIDSGDHVWLEVQTSRSMTVALNAKSIGQLEAGTVRFEVANQLDRHCLLELTVDVAEESGHDTIAEVALVIEPCQ